MIIRATYAHFFKTLQNRVLAEKKDFHWINQFPSAWSESRRISLPCCFPWILALAFCRLPDVDAGSGKLDCLTRSSYADSCAKAHVAYNGKLMSCGGDLEGEEMAAEWVLPAHSSRLCSQTLSGKQKSRELRSWFTPKKWGWIYIWLSCSPYGKGCSRGKRRRWGLQV